MPITISGSTGIAGVDGSAATPAVQGTDTNTGEFFPAADTVAWATNGSERLRVASAGQIGIGGANYGTSGQVLTSNGAAAAPSWQAAAAGQLQDQYFSSSGSWTAPTGVTKVFVRVRAGGGGGGGPAGGGNGGGGGFGGFAAGIITVVPGTVYTVTVGTGGAGRAPNGGTGGTGTSSSFGALASATGGTGGGPGRSCCGGQTGTSGTNGTGTGGTTYSLQVDVPNNGVGGSGGQSPSGSGTSGGNGSVYLMWVG